MSDHYQLPDGESVDLGNYQIVLFMQHGCHFCHHFDPKLRKFADEIGIRVVAYTLDGEGDDSFPDAKPANDQIVETLFDNLQVATPTMFLVNRVSNNAELIAQGDMDIDEFKQLFEKSLSHLHEVDE